MVREAGRRFARRLAGHAGGSVAVEFALVLPLMLILYLCAFVLSDMIAANRKVTIAARTLTDLATRYSALSLTSTDTNAIAPILAAGQQVMYPYSSTNTFVRISQVCASSTSATTVTVSWSQTSTGANARTANSTFTVGSGLFATGTCQIMGEVTYAYTPIFFTHTGATVYLTDTIYMTPRLSASIPLS
ncbi:MAG TPA: TadE/TadG family type IV pilus assembly protein [Novosphingobium sp.]|nr:TadE/TadG family type IV pilus assembly protein [Novosphingobium sp.]